MTNQFLSQNLCLDSAPTLKSIRVLLVEDEVDIAELLRFILENAGAEVTRLSRATQALSVLQPLRYDILLSDVKLPDYDGEWLIRQIRSHQSPSVRQLPAVAVTSYLREASQNSLITAGFDFFLPKLADPDELIAVLFNALQKEVNQRS
jgi:CheY-like chemotaxis protein